MTTKKSIIPAALLLLLSFGSIAQVDMASITETNPCTAPKNREIFHDYIDAQQKKLLHPAANNQDSSMKPADPEISRALNESLLTRIDALQCEIEKDSSLIHQNKVRYLRGIENILRSYNANTRSGKVNPLRFPAILTAYETCMQRDRNGLSIAEVIAPLDYETALSVVRADDITFERNEGFRLSKELVILKYCVTHPDQVFYVLKENPDVFFADSLIRLSARKYPKQLYDYVQASNKLGVKIRGITDDVFISTVSRMARSKSGQQYFPFLDNIVKGDLSIADIDSASADSVLYYKLLVKTQAEYVERMQNRDTAFAYRELLDKLRRRAQDDFVNTINGLHNEPDAIRFESIQSMTAQELFYLAVLSDGLIYTSSYTKGVYPLMMKKINNRGDSLLLSLRFDHYRKFISQAAAYNTLSGFLATFPAHEDAALLMQAFVGNLEKSSGLEDGVDVADSYASIIETNKKLAADVLNLVKENYQRNLKENNARGKNIYNILYKLFLSADSTNRINLTSELGIPPVYTVPYSSLADTSGAVTIQMFFYGDEDGKLDYNLFLGMYNNSNWKVDKSNSQWVVVKSQKGKEVTIYANTPFDEQTGEDDKAQQELGRYFEENGIHPTITINRGHSYHAETTIGYMAPTSRIVFMGSCGGFHLIDAILQKSPDAHIVASKQIGKRDINRPFLALLTEKLRNGNNIDWIPFWHEFKNNARVEGFEDYIPPYKNLGAIFIKAYKQAMGDD
jgi:hypothetical protein